VAARCGSFRVTSSSSSPSSPRTSPAVNPRHRWPPGMRPRPGCTVIDAGVWRHSNKTLWLGSVGQSVIDRVETTPTICSWLPTTILPAALRSLPASAAAAASIASVFIRARGPWWRVIAQRSTPSKPSHCQLRPSHDRSTLIAAIRTNDTTGHQDTHRQTQSERDRQTEMESHKETGCRRSSNGVMQPMHTMTVRNIEWQLSSSVKQRSRVTLPSHTVAVPYLVAMSLLKYSTGEYRPGLVFLPWSWLAIL